MKLDRNENAEGAGKYALINMRRYRALPADQAAEAFDLIGRLDALGIIDKGAKGAEDEFFVIKLRDRYAAPALTAYANAAVDDDKEWGIIYLTPR